MEATKNRQLNPQKTTKTKREQNKNRTWKNKFNSCYYLILLRLVLQRKQVRGQTHPESVTDNRVISIRIRDKNIIDKKIKTTTDKWQISTKMHEMFVVK